jgi:diguanylate cyclase
MSVLIGTDLKQLIRLRQWAFGFGLAAAGEAIALCLAWAGVVALPHVLVWIALTNAGYLVCYAVIRTGVNLSLHDPSLTPAQMVLAFSSGIGWYCIAGPARGTAFPMLMIIIVFGSFGSDRATTRAVCVAALAVFGVSAATMAVLDPVSYTPQVELAHFLVFAALLPAVAKMAGDYDDLRRRLAAGKAELSAALHRVNELAGSDPLTGLANRRRMQELLEAEVRKQQRTSIAFCVAVVDIDHFKVINDTYGHTTGDQVLQHFAALAKATFRGGDVVARWGGEEFLVLLPMCRLEAALLAAERLRRDTASMCLDALAPSLALTVSIGVAEHVPGEPIGDVVLRADRAVYAAKSSGRNCVMAGASTAPSTIVIQADHPVHMSA